MSTGPSDLQPFPASHPSGREQDAPSIFAFLLPPRQAAKPTETQKPESPLGPVVSDDVRAPVPVGACWCLGSPGAPPSPRPWWLAGECGIRTVGFLSPQRAIMHLCPGLKGEWMERLRRRVEAACRGSGARAVTAHAQASTYLRDLCSLRAEGSRLTPGAHAGARRLRTLR